MIVAEIDVGQILLYIRFFCFPKENLCISSQSEILGVDALYRKVIWQYSGRFVEER